MSKQKTLAAATLTALCLTAVCSLHAKAAQAAQDGERQDGMVVVRDAQTGKMRAPTPAELKALRARDPQAGAALAAAPRAAALGTRSDGARGVRLGDKTMVYEVVTRGADGKLSRVCVEGAGPARHAVEHAETVPSHADSRENAHESR